MKTLYIISQSFAENKGSFSGVLEDFVKCASLKNKYQVIILCAKNNNKELSIEKLSYATVIRFPKTNSPFLGNIVQAIYSAGKVRAYLKGKVFKDDLIFTNGESALGVLNQKYVVRAGDQPAFTFLKNMEIAKKQTPIISRAARLVHLTIQYFLEWIYLNKASGIVYASEETKEKFINFYHCGNKPSFIPRSGVEI